MQTQVIGPLLTKSVTTVSLTARGVRVIEEETVWWNNRMRMMNECCAYDKAFVERRRLFMGSV